MDIPPSPASDLMTLTHVPSEIYLRMLLRKCFSSFERYMDFVLKSVAKLHSAWTADNTWLQELQSCVGITTRAQMRRDSEWDTYIICEVLKKLLVQVYLAHSTCRGDDETEILRNSVHQVAYTRQLISHNLRPSYVEIVSCAFAALDICKVFPFGKDDLYQSTVAELEALADSAKVVIQLTVDASKILSVQRHELCQMALEQAGDDLRDCVLLGLLHADLVADRVQDMPVGVRRNCAEGAAVGADQGKSGLHINIGGKVADGRRTRRGIGEKTVG